MNLNPRHWRRLLDSLGYVAATLRAHENGRADGPGGCPAAGVPVLDPCPPELLMPLRSVARRAFADGNPLAALAVAMLDVNGWTRDEIAAEGSRRVQVVVPVRGAHDALRLCLGCLYAHTDPEAWEIAVAHAKDEHDAIMDAWQDVVTPHSGTRTDVHAMTDAPQSFAANVNLGASRSRSEFIVLLNSDAFVGPGWLDALLAPFADPEVVAVGPMGTNVSGHQGVQGGEGMCDVGEIAASIDAFRRHAPGGRESYAARRLVGFCLAVRRSAWDKVGGLDERFANSHDDDDLSLRLNLVGKCVVVPDLLVLHAGSASFRELPDAAENYNRTLAENRKRFEAKWNWILPSLEPWLKTRGVR